MCDEVVFTIHQNENIGGVIMSKRKLRKQIAITMLSTAFIVTPILNDTYLSSPFTLSVYAESSEASSLDWTLENGILTISGTGKMATSSLSIPWSDRLNEIHSVVIEDGITNVGSFAFRNCSKLVSITLPESIKTIEKNAFKNCISLYSVEFPVGIKVIERGAFSGCTALQEVVFPNTLDSIDKSAFEGCTSLKKAVIPDSVSTIGDYAFESCNEQFVICCAFGCVLHWIFHFMRSNNSFGKFTLNVLLITVIIMKRFIITVFPII